MAAHLACSFRLSGRVHLLDVCVFVVSSWSSAAMKSEDPGELLAGQSDSTVFTVTGRPLRDSSFNQNDGMTENSQAWQHPSEGLVKMISWCHG